MTYLTHPSYIQKSLIFIVPLVLPKRHRKVRPKNSYLIDENEKSKLDDFKLTITYPKESKFYDQSTFAEFEKNILINNKYFVTLYEVIKTRAYVFNIKEFQADVKKVLRGEYTRLSDSSKSKIIDYFSFIQDTRKIQPSEILAVFKPTVEDYTKIANDLGVDVELIEGGEILDKPDLEKETFKEVTFEDVLTLYES